METRVINMNQKEKFEKLVELSSKETEKSAELVARSFYRILRKSGYSREQIISIATSLLDCLVQSLDGYKKKRQKKETLAKL